MKMLISRLTMMVLVFGVALALPACSGPGTKEPTITADAARSLQAESRPATVTAFLESVPWRSATGTAKDRMMWFGESGDVHYLAMWKKGDETYLVVLKQSPIELFGSIFNCEIFDRSGKQVRTGLIHCGQDEIPYCLLEVQTATKNLPADYQNTWLLCVGFLARGDIRTFEPSRKSVVMTVDSEDIDIDDINPVSLEPVKWGDDHKRISFGRGALDRERLLVRFAEDGESPVQIITGNRRQE